MKAPDTWQWYKGVTFHLIKKSGLITANYKQNVLSVLLLLYEQ